MSTQTESNSSRLQKKYLLIIFLSYAVFALIFGLAYRYAMNPDGTSVLRLAGYLAEGNFLQSVSSGYSPFVTWIIALFIFFGFEGLTAARIAIALCGAGLIYCSWILAQRFDLPQNIRFIAVLVAAPLIAFWTIQFISPDVLFATLLLLYLYLVTDPDILNTRKLSFLCGITAGFSYLAHHYALPFFLVHFPVILLTRGYIYRDKEGLPIKTFLRSWGAGIAGFFLIASLWIGVVSIKYERLSISPKGGIAHAIMGPDDKDRRHPFFVGGLYKPRDPYAIHIFEDISDVKFETWSPFESKEYFIHQLRVIKINAVSILNHFVTQSPFFTRAFVICILALIPVAFWLNPLSRRRKFLYSWIFITFSIYCSGFLLLIARSPRRFYALMLIFLLLSFHFMEQLKDATKDMLSSRRRRLLSCYLLIIIVTAFALKPGTHFIKAVRHVMTVDQMNPYREIAGWINAVEFPGPYAIIRSSQKPTTDYYFTYFLDKQLLGRPLSSDPDGLTKELKSAGAKSLLVFDNQNIVEMLKGDDRYLHITSIKLNGNNRYNHAVNWVITKHEIITGWDDEVSIFTFK